MLKKNGSWSEADSHLKEPLSLSLSLYITYSLHLTLHLSIHHSLTISFSPFLSLSLSQVKLAQVHVDQWGICSLSSFTKVRGRDREPDRQRGEPQTSGSGLGSSLVHKKMIVHIVKCVTMSYKKQSLAGRWLCCTSPESTLGLSLPCASAFAFSKSFNASWFNIYPSIVQ